MRVDSHCHASPIWYEPVDVVLFQMDRCGVDKAVLVQMLGQYDNSYQLECLHRFPDRLSAVMAVDPGDPEALAALERLAGQGARGARLRPSARSPGDDPLAIWRLAQRLALTVSCVGTMADFRAPAFADLVAEVPGLPIVLEHLGGVARPDADAGLDDIWGLARFGNIHLKAPGLGQLAPRASPLKPGERPIPLSAAAPVRAALQAFGPRRLMWASDFPPVSSREGYGNALGGLAAALADLPDAARDEIFGAAAARLFF
jgi:L-fuconolactonase